jgi:inorganic pyrophosphatase
MKKKNLHMIVEIPKGSANKYEYNIGAKNWELDRVLTGAMFYPEEYGFIPETLDYDGDPLDVVCLTSYATFSGCYLPIRIVGVLKMIDGGEKDDKILAVNAVDPRFQNINDLKNISNGKLDEIANFFLRYKELEKKEVVIEGWGNKKEAREILEKCQSLFKVPKYRELVEQGVDKKKKLVELLKNEEEK